MAERTNKSTGDAFLGCAAYPKCKGTRSLRPASRLVGDEDLYPTSPLDDGPVSFYDEAFPGGMYDPE